nr:HEPN domain-containing protein [Bosea sp. Leaf344]
MGGAGGLLKISETTKAKLAGNIRRALAEVDVWSNCLVGNVSSFQALDANVKLDSDAFKLVTNIISEDPLYIFFSDWIAREIFERDLDKSQSKVPVKLELLPGVPSSEHLAEEMIRDFCQLPFSYKIFLSLPAPLSGLIHPEQTETDYGGGIKILWWSDKLEKSYPGVIKTTKEPKDQGSAKFLSGKETDDKERLMVLELCVGGFLDRKNNRSISVDLALEKVKSFFGLCVATGLCGWGSPAPRASYFAASYRVDNDLIIPNNTWPIPVGEDFARTLSLLTVPTSDPDALRRSHERIRKAHGSSRSERIMLASKWLFDSVGGFDQLFAFLQCTICLEILLGEQKYADNLSVGDILSNRCAYMVGNNDEDRDHILKDFREIYAVRSEIVHRGKSRLSQQNKIQLQKLRNYCGRVIRKEIDFLALPNG